MHQQALPLATALELDRLPTSTLRIVTQGAESQHAQVFAAKASRRPPAMLQSLGVIRYAAANSWFSIGKNSSSFLECYAVVKQESDRLAAPRDGASRMKKTGVDAPHRAVGCTPARSPKAAWRQTAHGFSPSL